MWLRHVIVEGEGIERPIVIVHSLLSAFRNISTDESASPNNCKRCASIHPSSNSLAPHYFGCWLVDNPLNQATRKRFERGDVKQVVKSIQVQAKA